MQLLLLVRTTGGGSILWQGSGLANLIVRILESVPSIFKLGRNLVLFFVTMLNTRSSAAFEYGRVSARRATFASLGNFNSPSILNEACLGLFAVCSVDEMLTTASDGRALKFNNSVH